MFMRYASIGRYRACLFISNVGGRCRTKGAVSQARRKNIQITDLYSFVIIDKRRFDEFRWLDEVCVSERRDLSVLPRITGRRSGAL